MSRKHKVHLVEPSRVRFEGREPDWLTICPVLTAEHFDPAGTTRDPARATCGHCKRIIAKRLKEAADIARGGA